MVVPEDGATAEPTHEDDEWVKVLLRGPHDGEVERLWARTVGEGLFQLENLPWYAYGVSDDDVVEARPTEEGEGSVFEFVRVVRQSGNRLVRCVFDESAPDGLLAGLVSLGCYSEAANPRYLAVGIPPAVSLDEVARYLTDAAVRWEYANPDIGGDPDPDDESDSESR